MRKYICEPCKLKEIPPPVKDCLGCKKVKAHLWYLANKDKVADKHKQWRTKNPELLAAQKRRYSQKPKGKEKWLRWERNNPEKVRARKKRWRVRHREQDLESRKLNYSRRTYAEFSEAHRMLCALKRELRNKNEVE